MVSRKLKSTIIVLSLVSVATVFIVLQLSKFSVDVSLSGWEQDISGYIKVSRQQAETNKPIALFFYTDWCSSCKELRENILATAEVKSYFEGVHPVKINPENGVMENKLAEDFGVVGYPSFYLVQAETGAIEQIRKTYKITPDEFVQQIRDAEVKLLASR